MLPRPCLDPLIGHVLQETGAEGRFEGHVAALIRTQLPEDVCQGPLTETRGLALTRWIRHCVCLCIVTVYLVSFP